MYTPQLEQVKELAQAGGFNLATVFAEVSADLETPVSAFLKVARGDYSFLLESVEGGERMARYSFIGTEPYRVLRSGPYSDPNDGHDPLAEVEAELASVRLAPSDDGLPRFTGGAVGFLAYDCVRYFEPRVPIPARDSLGLPEAVFLFVDTLLVFDHIRHTVKVIAHCRLDADVEASYSEACERIAELVDRLARPLPAVPYPLDEGMAVAGSPVSSSVGKESYLANVEAARKYIIAGDIIQVVPSQRLSRRTLAHPFSIYRALRSVNPSPYMYYLHLGDSDIVGTSPEMLVRVEDGLVSTHPIAGTRRRGRDSDEDEALERELQGDEKERAEHIMLVDLGRNDIGRVSQPGSVQVTQLMEVERYSHVMHLVSHITGRLRDDLSPYDALRACFPAGTVSGAPKIRAMEIIAELEPDRRGPYAGAVGYFDYRGNLDTAITIRTIVMKDGLAHVQAGGGVVYDSVPESEHEESLSKARALLLALDRAEAMEAEALARSRE
ncbi:MAG TPA: anthranilate synthase component I [Dehalococcoidia bacterium]|nr:anthranilate synthase component I [Dehalococcoidia bacterium]